MLLFWWYEIGVFCMEILFLFKCFVVVVVVVFFFMVSVVDILLIVIVCKGFVGYDYLN